MPIVNIKSQPDRPQMPIVNPMSVRGKKPQTKTPPTPGSKTQKRKRNKVNHKPFSK